jgi:GTP:adenosylcobinamide-phosphate guanylyltransferase
MLTHRIEAVTVNQNTSCFVELLLRSLYATHNDLEGLRLTILDNNSTDGTEQLKPYAAEKEIPIVQTRWTPSTPGNNHGENLRDFVLSHQDCDCFLFLDADIVFVQGEIITTMAQELAGAGKDVWAVQARFTEDGEKGVPWGSLDKGGARKFINIMMEDAIEDVQPGKVLQHLPMPAVIGDRMYPCCCLIKNTDAFLLTAREIGFSCVNFEESGGGKVYDTMGLATQVMKTHGLRFILSSKMVKHFWGVARKQRNSDKDAACEKLLAKYRPHVA